MTIKDACKQLNERCKGVDILSLDPQKLCLYLKDKCVRVEKTVETEVNDRLYPKDSYDLNKELSDSYWRTV